MEWSWRTPSPEGDAGVLVGRDELDPGPSGRHLERALGRLQPELSVEAALAPGHLDRLALVEQDSLAAALELGLGHRVAGGVAIAGVAARGPDDPDVVGLDIVALRGEGAFEAIAGRGIGHAGGGDDGRGEGGGGGEVCGG